MAARTTSDDATCTVGVDGGGSGVRAGVVATDASGWLHVVGDVAERDVSSGSDARAWILAASDAILEVAGETRRLRFGMGMPGRKTDDGRGIAHALHGPVEPRFADLLEDELSRRGVELLAPCTGLGDDGVLGCTGELLGRRGSLRGVSCGYYVGGGTGLAEAFVIDGSVVPFERAPRPLERAWRLADGEATIEERLSVRGINARFRRESGRAELPEQGVELGEEAARRVFVRAVWDLVRLVWLREQALALAFERVVVAQRLAQVLDHPAVRPIFAETMRQVGERGGDVALSERLVLSQCRDAAILGAAARCGS